MKILFVEDEMELNTMATQTLTDMGHKVLSAINLEQARRLFDLHFDSIDMILSDHRLPDGQGINFILEAREKKPKAKVAVVSGVLTDEEKEFLNAEGVRFFMKPLLYANVIRSMTRPPINAPVKKKDPFESDDDDAHESAENANQGTEETQEKRGLFSRLFRRS